MRILQLHTDSHPASVGDARRRVRQAMIQAGLDVETAQNMEVAVGETLSNVSRHAYPASIGPVSVEVLHTAARMTVVITDEGGATVAPGIPGALPARSSRGGCGLYMVGRLVDDVEIHVNPTGHGLTVRMTASAKGGDPTGSPA